MAAECDSAVLYSDGDRIEWRRPVAHAIVFQLLSQLGLQLFIGDCWSGDFNLVSDRCNALGFAHALLCVSFVFE